MIYNHLPVEDLMAMKQDLESKIAQARLPVKHPPPGYRINYGLIREYQERIDTIDRVIQDKYKAAS